MPHSFEVEDRSRDWFCGKCRERNFVKRTECYRCGMPRPQGVEQESAPKPMNLQAGATLNGMVKSYNRKGFGFLMCFGDPRDIYYTRQNLCRRMETCDIPGRHVTFELSKTPDGKLMALNIRPIGEDIEGPPVNHKISTPAEKVGAAGGYTDEGFSRDWRCLTCGERNPIEKSDCRMCRTSRKAPASEAPGRPVTKAAPLSPHAGSRAMAMGSRAMARSRSRSRDRDRKKKKKRKKKSRSSSSSTGSKRDRRRKKGKDSSASESEEESSESSPSVSQQSVESDSSDCKEEPAGSALEVQSHSNPEIVKSMAEAKDELVRLQSVEPLDVRMKEWRALLRKWHPDKNPDRVEVATAVFQFLQKGKVLLGSG